MIAEALARKKRFLKKQNVWNTIQQVWVQVQTLQAIHKRTA